MNLKKMKAPGDNRATWGDGIIQIHITRACDLACIGCTQGSQLAGKPVIMSPTQFAIAAESLVDYHGVVGIFGGNPCVHPQFEAIARALQRIIPKERCGLWSNNLMGYGKLCREVFNPEFSNLNVHCNIDVYLEISRDWPEAHPKGAHDSRHSPPYVALQDMEDMTDDERWELIESCDINQFWSAMICVFRGELRGYFCELAGAQSMLHEKESDYPDTGCTIDKDWWRYPIELYANQIKYHCMACGIPLRGRGDLAMTGNIEQVSKTHENIYKLKRPNGKLIQVITKREQLNGSVTRATDYIQNGLI
jgi:hypothetical protein